MLAVLFEQKGNTGIATINRTKANQLSHEVFEDFSAILDRVESDDSVRVLVITGAGEKIFCAGGDRSQGNKPGHDSRLWRDYENAAAHRVDKSP